LLSFGKESRQMVDIDAVHGPCSDMSRELFLRRILETAQSEVGVREQPLGSNDGPRVRQYWQRTGYRFPVFWCMCFLWWVIDEVCEELGVENLVPRSGDCDTVEAWGAKRKILFKTPQPGDLGFVTRSKGTDAYHVFLVKEVHADYLITIEGNSNAGGSNNGDGVYERRRERRSNHNYVRFALLMVPEAEAVPSSVALYLGAEKLMDSVIVRGRTLVPVRALAKALGDRSTGVLRPVTDGEIGWSSEDEAVTIHGRVLGVELTMREGKAYLAARDLAEFLGFKIKYDPKKNTVIFS